MSESHSPDPEYLTPEPQTEIMEPNGKSPLAMLQEICRNIGNDISEESKTSSNSNNSKRSSISPLSQKRAASRPLAAAHSPKSRRSSAHSHLSADSPHKPIPLNPTATKAAVHHQSLPTLKQNDANDLLLAHYQMLYQKILYQNELEKIKLSMTPPATPTNPPTSLYSSINSFYQSTGLPPAFPPSAAQSLTSHTPQSMQALDMTRLSAIFYERLGQFLPQRDNKFSNVPPQIQPTELKLHQCNWVTANGFCGKSFYSNEDLLTHLRSHVCNITDCLPTATSTTTIPGPLIPGLCRSQINDDIRQSMYNMSPPAFRYKPYSITPKSVPTLFL